MMSALMRLFFGASAEEVPRNTALGTVAIEHPNDPSLVAPPPIRFSDNSMDVISLLVPEAP